MVRDIYRWYVEAVSYTHLVNDATAFLETFFKLYPTATEKELAYYVSGNVTVSYTHLDVYKRQAW